MTIPNKTHSSGPRQNVLVQCIGYLETDIEIAYFQKMQSQSFPLRKFIALIMAAFFMLAVQPGTMAMGNTGTPSSGMTGMADCHHGKMPCRHTGQQPDKKSPCKNMAVCLGMLSCYGVTALSSSPVLPLRVSVRALISSPFDFSAGITHRPDNPPPIA